MHNRPPIVPRRGQYSLALCVLLVALVSATSSAFAQTTTQQMADALFREAIALAKQEQFDEAIVKFKASYALDPAPGTLQGLAMAEERAGKLVAAFTHYQELLDLARKSQDAHRQEAARVRIEAIMGQISRVSITATAPLPANAELTLDSQPLPHAVLGTPLPVDPGTHVVGASAPDARSFSKTVNVQVGQAANVVVVLEHEPDARTPLATQAPSYASHSHARTLRISSYASAGVGALGLLGGLYFWMASGSTYSDLETSCPGHQCPQSMRSRVDDGKSQESWARAGFIVGTLGVATGAVLFVLANRAEKKAISPSATVGFGPTSIHLAGAF